jgi:hypothetical protein
MKSSMVTRGFGAFSFLMLAGAAVLVFHSAAYAQQAKPDEKPADEAGAESDEFEKAKPQAKEAEEAKPEKTAPESATKEAPPPEEMPPEYGPPPGYRRHRSPPAYDYPPRGYGRRYDDYYGGPAYPPPRYYRPRPHRPAPVRYYPEPIAYRTFFFGLGLGIGGVALFPEGDATENSSRAGMAYNLHFGFGVSPRWSIVLSGDGAYAYFSGYSIDQSVWSIGPQVFINRHLYVRAGIGVATKSISDESSYYYDSYYDYYSFSDYGDSGMGWTLAVGWEFMQSYHASLGLEVGATFGRYHTIDPITGSRNQGTLGINFTLNLF